MDQEIKELLDSDFLHVDDLDLRATVERLSLVVRVIMKQMGGELRELAEKNFI